MSRKKYFFTFYLFILAHVVCSEKMLKSSLTFVIDDTGSMGNDIYQVKKGANAIFDIVMNSNASQIEDFVLVTFNDPETESRITTRDRDAFKNALASISVDGGDDCPEMAMAGIERALLDSRPFSYLYVFTDASAKDDTKYRRVKELAQKMQSQVVFVLTGDCKNYFNKGNDKVYYDLAEDTSGQVFNINKQEVGMVLKYVEETIRNRKTVIAHKNLPSGTHKFPYNVDSTMKEIVISVSGTNPSVVVTDPDGDVAAIEDITRTAKVAIVKVKEVKPGVYNAEVSSESETTVVVSGSTTVHFEHGFSRVEPSSIDDTATRPIPGEESYLAIKLNTEEAIQLKTVQLLDMDNNVILEKPLRLVIKKDKFYIANPLSPPNVPFRVAIKGYDTKTNTEITRISLTPIEPQSVKDERETPNKAPEVTTVGESKINVAYNMPMQLRCKVAASPKPKVVWEDNEGNVLSSTLSLVELPYDYVSVLEIERVNKNATYTCKADNSMGNDYKRIEIETVKTEYFDVIEVPRGAIVEYEKEEKFVCNVDALPPATITWYLNGNEVAEDDNIAISPNRSVLVIKSMQPEYDGLFMCEARNENNRELFRFSVSISGLEPPEINKSSTEIRIREGSSADITCRIVAGKPRPALTWYFKHRYSDRTEDRSTGDEIVHIDNASPEHSGTYGCEAKNVAGSDYHYTELIVEYPPTVKKSAYLVTAKEGERLRLSCFVKGEPKPTVKWSLGDTEIIRSRHYSIHTTNSLSFKASLNDSGIYTCEAMNSLGFASKTIKLQVVAPPRISTPEDFFVKVEVGDTLTLPCHASGEPNPEIKWIFQSADPKKPVQIIKPHSATGSLRLRRIQLNKEGYYTCVASNVGGQANITYDVNIYAPPIIENVYPEKEFTSVLGDLVVRVPCRATGNPKPVITWIKGGFNIAAGPYYDIEEDGTLVVKNVDKAAEGVYVCNAQNRLGFDNETYEVIVEAFPKPKTPTSSVFLEEGDTASLICEVPHKRTDSLRWFKDGTMIKTGELTLKNVKTSDSGIYTCRVSDFSRSRNAYVKVSVGYKPRFEYDLDEEHIEFEKGISAVLDCSAVGAPEPEISWWHDGDEIDEKNMVYIFEMKAADRGQYFCLVKNDLGYITRKFEISSKECLINIEKDLQGNQPLMVSQSLKLPSYPIVDGHMLIRTGEYVLLYCPSGFKEIGSTGVVAYCDKNTDFKVDKKTYKFSDLKCNDALEPLLKNTGSACQLGNTEKIKIGYEISDRFLEAYEICYDKDNKIPLYSKQSIESSLANTDVESPKWFKNELVPYDFDALYNCALQINTISSILGRWFHKDDMCCFSKRQLVNPRDVYPGLVQTATYSYLNVVPQWSTCSAKNWESVEQRVRNLAKSADRELLVWTGTAHKLFMQKEHTKTDIEINISDRESHQQHVPRYLWKVVQDPESQASLAIIQVNAPDLTLSEAYYSMLCRDICYEVPWMRSSTWRDVKFGYTYCCNILDFERAFGYTGMFNSGSGKVLYDLPVVHALT